MSANALERTEVGPVVTAAFESLAESCRHCEAGQVENIELAVGDLLEVPGRDPEAVVWLRSGRVELRVERGEVWRQVVGDVGPGEVVGLGPVVLGHPSTHVAEVREAGTGLRVRREAMRAILREQSGLVRSLLRTVLTRGQTMERRIAELSLLSLEQRVVRALLRKAEDDTVRMSHEELASRVGGSREEVTRVLSRLRRRGLVQTGRRRVSLQDRPALERLAVPLRGLE